MIPLPSIAPSLILAATIAAGVQTWRLESLRAEVATERLEMAVAEQQRTQRAIDDQQEVSRAALERTARTRADVGRAGIAGAGLRLRASAIADSAASSAAAGRCDDAASTSGVLADVLTGMEARGRAIAEWADSLETSLNACQQAYRAVTQ